MSEPALRSLRIPPAPLLGIGLALGIAWPLGPAMAAPQPGHLLSPDQVARLSRLPIPVLVPTHVPAGFRVVRVEAESGQYANGDDDSGYLINYQGSNRSCFTIYSASGGARGLTTVGQEPTAFGVIKISVDQRFPSNLSAFFPVEGNPLLITGAGGCGKALPRAEFVRILRSVAVLRRP